LSVSTNGSSQLDFEITSQSKPILHLLLLVFSSSKKEVSEKALSISKKDTTGGANKKAEKIKINI
jgi:hypothetical protein